MVEFWPWLHVLSLGTMEGKTLVQERCPSLTPIPAPQKPAILTTLGVLEEPLGNARLHGSRLIAALLHTNTPSINQELCRLSTMDLLLVSIEHGGNSSWEQPCLPWDLFCAGLVPGGQSPVTPLSCSEEEQTLEELLRSKSHCLGFWTEPHTSSSLLVPWRGCETVCAVCVSSWNAER